jgi:ABC-type sugar transport system substrate-binding protein
MEREAGFANRMVEAHKGITLLPWNEYTGPVHAEALQKCRGALAAYGAQADAIFVSTQFAGNAMLRALHDFNPAKPIPLIVFDTNPTLVDALRQGEVDALVVQSEKQIGRDAVQLAYRKMRGEAVSRTFYTPVTIATQANMTDKKIQDLLTPVTH